MLEVEHAFDSFSTATLTSFPALSSSSCANRLVLADGTGWIPDVLAGNAVINLAYSQLGSLESIHGTRSTARTRSQYPKRQRYSVPPCSLSDSHPSSIRMYGQPAPLLEEKADSDHQALLMLEAEQAPVDHLLLGSNRGSGC